MPFSLKPIDLTPTDCGHFSNLNICRLNVLTLGLMCLTLSACQLVTAVPTKRLQTTQVAPTAVTGADATAPEQGTGRTAQQLVTAENFMLATANPLATQAGYEVLKRGGSAIDAMVTVQTTLGLVEPQSSGLGGGAYALYWDASTNELTSFDARETAPMAATPTRFLDDDGEPLKFMDAVVGGLSVGTPGVPKLMHALHDKYGKLEWQSLFATPYQLAKDGFVVSPRLAQSIAHNAHHLSRFAKTQAYFLPQGQPLQAGMRLKNPAYAKTVLTLQSEGSAPFYHGHLADNIIKQVANAPGNAGDLQSVDFKRYRIIERPPVCSAYRQYRVCGMGGSSSGGIAVGQIVGMLNQFEPSQLQPNNVNTYRILGDASRLAFADRGKYVGDPDYVTVPTNTLLSPNYLKQRAEMIKSAQVALPEVAAGSINNTKLSHHAAFEPLELPSTSHIVIKDQYGNVLSMTSSIENAFGSTLMANGYLLNNELTDFSFRPKVDGKPVANRVEAGKRPRSSMAPTLVMQGTKEQAKPYLAVGSPGGSRIIGYVSKTLLAHIDWGMDIQDAISTPNVLNRFGVYELEQHTAATRLAAPLQAIGYKVQTRDLNSGIQGIVINSLADDDKRLEGGADPRREGKVMGE